MSVIGVMVFMSLRITVQEETATAIIIGLFREM